MAAHVLVLTFFTIQWRRFKSSDDSESDKYVLKRLLKFCLTLVLAWLHGGKGRQGKAKA